MKLPPLLRAFLLLSGLGTVLCLSVEVVCRWLLGWPYPYNYPLLPATPIFADFFEYIPKFTRFHSPGFFLGPPLAYPAATVVLLRPFMLGGDRHVRLSTCFFLAFSLLCFTCAAVFFAKSLVRRGLNPRSANLFVIATFVMAFPIWFDLHQANVESLVWTVTTLGLWAMWTNRSWSAAVLLGYAVALKLFPIILLALFLSRRMYKQLTLALVVAATATVVSLYLVCPDIAYSLHATLSAMSLLHGYMTSGRVVNTGFDHSALTLVKLCLPASLSPSALGKVVNLYLLSAAVAGLALYFLRIRRLPLANQIICLSLASIVLPPVSFDYTLLHLYVPLALFCYATLDRAAGRSTASTRILPAGLALLAFLLSLQSEIIWHGVQFPGQCRALALLCLLGIAAFGTLPIVPLGAAQPARDRLQENTI